MEIPIERCLAARALFEKLEKHARAAEPVDTNNDSPATVIFVMSPSPSVLSMFRHCRTAGR